jgi:hypothetical protein
VALKKIDWKTTQIQAEIFLGLSGLCLSATLVWSEYSERRRDSRQEMTESTNRYEEALVGQFQNYYRMAREANINDPRARTDLDLAGAVAQKLAGPPFAKSFYNDAVVTLRAQFEATDRVPGRPSTQIGALSLQAEAAATPVDTQGWFAVVASYSKGEQGLNLAKQLVDSIRDKLPCLEIWQSQKSGVFAVVVGGQTDRSHALAYAQQARLTGVAKDAFTQANHDLKRIQTCRLTPAVSQAARV